jgi:subtilisin family serine protease
MKKLLPILFTFHFSLFALQVVSQSNTKMDYYLASKLQLFAEKKANVNQMLSMLVQGKITTIKQLVQSHGGVFKYSYGNIAAISIPVSALEAFNESGAVKRMEGAPRHLTLCSDTMRLRNSIVAVQQGLFPLPQGYNGKGIVIGFIDTGIDYTHPDFVDSTGHSRVKYYWDQNQPVGIFTPLPYGYGAAWTGTDIDLGLANNSAAGTDAHGSNVAGSATSNARANGTCLGGAPDCDIVYVALDFNSPDPNIVTDAVNYIYTMADSLNEPCVINVSLGSYDGSHDGLDLQALMIDSMILARQPGRVMVVAAGNAGNIEYHLHDSVSSSTDTTFTWFNYDGGYGGVYIPVYADSSDFTHINFAIGVDKVSAGYFSERAITTFTNINAYLGGPDSVYVLNSLGDTLGKIDYYAQEYYPGVYYMQYLITTDSTNYYWRLITTGTGRFDAWAISSGQNGTDIIDTTGLLLSQTIYPEIRHYVEPDFNQTLCSSFQCSPDVITVANYYNRQCWVDYDTALECIGTNIPGKLAGTSSWGPTRNYALIKPDIGGAGGVTMAALPISMQAGYISGDPTAVDIGAWHLSDGGTSLASPGVASVAALYLERYPNATYSDVWYAITHCDSVDSFTGAVPNYKFGYGKVHAFRALTGGCTPAGIEDIAPPSNPFTLNAYPNPVTDGATIVYDFSSIKNYEVAQIVFYDMLGKEVKAVSIKGNKGSVNIEKNALPSGMYFYSLMVNSSRLRTEKLDIL